MQARPQIRRIATLALGCAVVVSGCAPMRGYPSSMENSDEVLQGLKPYFSAAKEREYAEAPARAQQALRNQIVLARMRAFDIEFDDFQERLFGDGNAVGIGGGIAALVLAGLGATTGHAVTASALAASAGGLAGAQALISKDLYYTRTVPALIAQMQANRAKAKRPILIGMRLTVAQYPLEQALSDLQVLKTAGSIPAAVGNITQQAEIEKDAANKRLEAVRTLDYTQSASADRLRAWFRPGGTLNVERRNELLQWMRQGSNDAVLREAALSSFLNGDDPLFESDRQRAIVDLKVPPQRTE